MNDKIKKTPRNSKSRKISIAHPKCLDSKSVYIVQHQTYPETISVFSSLEKAQDKARRLLIGILNSEIRQMKSDKHNHTAYGHERYMKEYKEDKLTARRNLAKALDKFNKSFRDTLIWVFKRKVF